MRKGPLLPPLPRGEGLRVEKEGGTILGRGVGELVVVGLGHNGGLKGRSKGDGMFRDEERGGHEG